VDGQGGSARPDLGKKAQIFLSKYENDIRYAETA
jgi:hypothetical protein